MHRVPGAAPVRVLPAHASTCLSRDGPGARRRQALKAEPQTSRLAWVGDRKAPVRSRRGGTAKHAKGAKMTAGRIVFKDENCQVVVACFEVCKVKGNGFLEAV